MNAHFRVWYVYLLECADGTLYTGITLDPQRRLREHNTGRGARYTRTRGPVRLLGSVAVSGRGEAIRLETQVKGWTPARKRAFFAAPQAEIRHSGPQQLSNATLTANIHHTNEIGV